MAYFKKSDGFKYLFVLLSGYVSFLFVISFVLSLFNNFIRTFSENIILVITVARIVVVYILCFFIGRFSANLYFNLVKNLDPKFIPKHYKIFIFISYFLLSIMILKWVYISDEFLDIVMEKL